MQELIKKYKKLLDDKKPQTTNKIKYVSNYVKKRLELLLLLYLLMLLFLLFHYFL